MWEVMSMRTRNPKDCRKLARFWGVRRIPIHTRMQRPTSLLALVCAACITNCGGDDSTGGEKPACNANDTRMCVGPGACAGGQVCGPDGNWNACDCGGGTGGATIDGSAAASGVGASAGNGGVGGASGGGGVSGAPLDGGASDGASGSGGGAGAPADGGGGATGLDCSAKFGSKMVNIDGKFCMDQREATYAEYKQFYDDTLVHPFQQPSGCSGNLLASVALKNAWLVDPDDAVGYVDLCDAKAFCQWSGKRLCGKIGGGTLVGITYKTDNPFGDPKQSEWVNVCSNGGYTTYPYGFTVDATKCGTPGKKPMAAPDCHGLIPPYSEVFDMGGNVAEWVDGKAETGNAVVMGIESEPPAVTYFFPCAKAWGFSTTFLSKVVGVRCCK